MTHSDRLQAQADILANFLMKEYGEEIGDEGSVDITIQLLKELKSRRSRMKRMGQVAAELIHLGY